MTVENREGVEDAQPYSHTERSHSGGLTRASTTGHRETRMSPDWPDENEAPVDNETAPVMEDAALTILVSPLEAYRWSVFLLLFSKN